MKLKKLILINFKGIKHLEIDFKDITTIQGANRTGKSTIFDAFLWLLFGKNSNGDTDFGVVRFLADGSRTTKQQVEVMAFININGKDIDFKRTLKEKWVKPRGQKESVLDGYTTSYEWNAATLPTAKDYKKRINELINEDFFKLLTNPLYFNSLGTEKKREMLNNLATEKKVVGLKYKHLFDLSNSDFADLRKAISSQIKKLKDELKELPVRIDEVHKNKPEPLKFKNIQAELNSKTRSLEAIDANILNKNKILIDFNDSKIKDQLELNDLKVQLETYKSDFKLNNNIERTEIERKIRENEREAGKSVDKIADIESEIETRNSALDFQNSERDKKLNEWDSENEKKFTSENCVSCGQKLQVDNINELKEDFLFNQNNELERISIEGKKIAFRMGELTQKIKNLGGEKFEADLYFNNTNIKIRDLEKELAQIKEPDINENKEYLVLKGNYDTFSAQHDSMNPPTIDDKELKEKKSLLILAIDELKKQMEVKTTILTALNRVRDLEVQTITKTDILQGLENKEFEMDEFNRAKMSALETEINKKFSFVKFKMFEAQINGGEKEVCTTLINGVPFADANSESRLNAGLDIINVFSEHYNISAPIFIDNREGVTDIIPVNAQIINLVVNPEFKTLKIS